MARPDAHRMERSWPLLRDLLQSLSGPLFHRRRLPARRGRLLLDHRPGRRRDQRLRPPDRHCRGRKLAGVPSQGRGGRGRRLPSRHQGQAIYAFVTLNAGEEGDDGLRKELVQEVRHDIGAFAAPEKIHFTPSLPKTRSGKIMRRILQEDRRGRDQWLWRHFDAGRSYDRRRACSQAANESWRSRHQSCSSPPRLRMPRIQPGRVLPRQNAWRRHAQDHLPVTQEDDGRQRRAQPTRTARWSSSRSSTSPASRRERVTGG